jgi:hypothetical protein
MFGLVLFLVIIFLTVALGWMILVIGLLVLGFAGFLSTHNPLFILIGLLGLGLLTIAD